MVKEIPIIEKELLKFFSNIDQIQSINSDVIELLEFWKKFYFKVPLSVVTKEALNIFFSEQDLLKGKEKMRFYLTKVDPVLIESPSWEVSELLNQSKFLIEDYLIKEFIVEINKKTFSGIGSKSSVEEAVYNFLGKLSSLKKSSVKIWDGEFPTENISEEEKIVSPFEDLIPYFGKKRLYIVAGFPGEGKTFFLINLANFFIRNGLKVLHVSLEMGISELLSRYLSLWSGVSVYGWVPEIFDRVYFDGIKSLSITELSSYSSLVDIDYLLFIKKVDVLLIDYIDLLSSYRSLDNMFLEFSEIARSLYFLAKERNVCIIAASQLNREGQISRSFGKQEICDGLLVLKRLSSKELQVKVEKLRHGPDKVFKIFNYDFSKAKIYFDEKSYEIEEVRDE